VRQIKIGGTVLGKTDLDWTIMFDSLVDRKIRDLQNTFGSNTTHATHATA